MELRAQVVETLKRKLLEQAVPSLIKRLTREEYTNRINDLFDTHFDLTDLLPEEIAKNVALLNFPVHMVLTSDHVTAATAKTVTGERYIDGATSGTAVTGAITEAEFGLYLFDAAQADTNGDMVTWRFSAADTDDFNFSFTTVS